MQLPLNISTSVSIEVEFLSQSVCIEILIVVATLFFKKSVVPVGLFALFEMICYHVCVCERDSLKKNLETTKMSSSR